MNFVEDKLLNLFGGNWEVYGLDQPDGSGVCVRQPVGPRIFKQHLEGTIGIGTYPMWLQDQTWYCRWGSSDIDTGIWEEAYQLARSLRLMGLNPYIERSRSKGWHVWLFVDRPVTAGAMRRCLKVAHKAAGVPAREVNPKAESLREGQIGNYLRVPFKGGKASILDRQTIVWHWNETTDGTPISVYEFLDHIDYGGRDQAELIEHWATKWVEPTREQLPPRQVVANGWSPTGLLDAVKNAKSGNRNDTLHWAAWRLGLDVFNGKVSQQDADKYSDDLVNAGLDAGLSVFESERTVQSGFTAGLDGRGNDG